MLFTIKHEKSIINKHTYINNDGLFHDMAKKCDFSLMLGCQYLGLDVNSINNRIYGVSGFVSIKQLPQESINMPKTIKEGALYLENCILEPNTVKNYSVQLNGKYDKKLNCICIGEDRDELEAFKIADDLFVSIYNDKIIAIFILL